MKKFYFCRLALIFIFCFFWTVTLKAQTDDVPPSPPEKNAKRADSRPNLLRELGLSTEQLQKIRQLNSERKPLMMEAQHRVRDAMRNLDLAIYADSVSETEIENKLKELQTAQAEIARLKARNELEVRKILTPEQLVRFREVRRRFAEKRMNLEKRRQNSGAPDQPNNFKRRNNRRFPQNAPNQ